VRAVDRLLFHCAGTVSELHLFERLRLLFERKQIPRIVVNIWIRRKALEPLEATRLPWAQWSVVPSKLGHSRSKLICAERSE
jgi:hypothetical protein